MTDRGQAEVAAEVAEQVGAAIRSARDDRGWRQTDLAISTGIPQGTISKWERGTLTPSIAELAWLEVCLELEPGMLFVGAGLVPPGLDVINAIAADPALDPAEQTFMLNAYFAARLVTRSEREAVAKAETRKQRRRPGTSQKP